MVSDKFLPDNKELACIHCGLCLGSCPTYLETGNEAESPRGRIHLMRAWQEGRAEVNARSARHIDLCLGCRACETACPSGVEYGALLEHARDHLEKHHRRPWGQVLLRRVLVERIFPHERRVRWLMAPGRWLRRWGAERWLPRRLAEPLQLIPQRSSQFVPPEISPAPGERRGSVAFVSGCIMPVLFGGTHLATVRLAHAAGYDVWTPSGQGCCGALFAHSGNLEKARESARRNIAVFEQRPVEAILINAAGCGSTLKEYGKLLADDAEWRGRAEAFASRVQDLSEWLARQPLAWQPSRELVTFHDACHLAHAQRVTQPPRQLVMAVAGRNFVPLPEADLCCGSAGTYNLTEPEMAARLQARKTANILATGAAVVVTTNPGCIMQIAAGLERDGRGVRVEHLADFLVRHLEPGGKDQKSVPIR